MFDAGRQSLRSLSRNPAFTAFAVMTLGLSLGIGLCIFGIVDAIRFPRYVIEAPEQLFTIDYNPPPRVDPTAAKSVARDVLTQRMPWSTAFATYSPIYVTIGGPSGESLQRFGWQATPSAFDVLGIQPAAGRFPIADSDVDATSVAISSRLWKRLMPTASRFAPFSVRLSGNLFAPGTASSDGMRFTVVGVMPDRIDEALAGGMSSPNVDIIVPMRNLEATGRWGYVLTRARQGTKASSIATNLLQLDREVAQAHFGGESRGGAFVLHPLVDIDRRLGPAHSILFAAALGLLAITCANIGNLQLARSRSRAREIAVRSALGATRMNLVALLVADSAILCIGGAAVGIGAAVWGNAALRQLGDREIPGLGVLTTQFSWHAIAFYGLAMVLIVAVSGLLPALQLSVADVGELARTNAGTGLTPRVKRWYGGLVIVQIAVAIVLLTAAARLIASAVELRRIDFGYRQDGLLVAQVHLEQHPLDQTVADVRAMTSLLNADDMVSSAASSIGSGYGNNLISISGRQGTREIAMSSADRWQIVSSEFLRTLGLRLIRGRDFAMNDVGSTPSAIIDSSTAAQLFGEEDPVGHLVKPGPAVSPSDWVQVVGVSRDVLLDVTESASVPHLFILRRPARIIHSAEQQVGSGLQLIIRTTQPSAASSDRIRQRLAAYGRVDVAPANVATGLAALLARETMLARLFLAIGMIGVVLAAAGVYAVSSFHARARTIEFGVRMALGADGATLVVMVFQEEARRIALGLVIALAIVYLGDGLVSAFVNDIRPIAELLAMGIGIALVVFCSLAASLIPALHVARINPSHALHGA